MVFISFVCKTSTSYASSLFQNINNVIDKESIIMLFQFQAAFNFIHQIRHLNTRSLVAINMKEGDVWRLLFTMPKNFFRSRSSHLLIRIPMKTLQLALPTLTLRLWKTTNELKWNPTPDINIENAGGRQKNNWNKSIFVLKFPTQLQLYFPSISSRYFPSIEVKWI